MIKIISMQDQIEWYWKRKSKLKLFGDVKIYGYQYENIFIEELHGDEFILFTDKGQFQINSKKMRVKTKFKFWIWIHKKILKLNNF